MGTSGVVTASRVDSAAGPHGSGGLIARLHSVSKRYGGVQALDNFSFELARGEVVALLGANGAGKTTAVRLLLGLIAPNSGSVRVLGQNLREAQALICIGAMLQVGRVPEVLRVRELIDMFRAYPAPMSIPEIVRIAKLEGLEQREYGKLSGGQKQRTLFAPWRARIR